MGIMGDFRLNSSSGQSSLFEQIAWVLAGSSEERSDAPDVEAARDSGMGMEGKAYVSSTWLRTDCGGKQ